MTGVPAVEARVERRRRALAASLVVAAATTVATGCAHALGGGTAPDALLLLAALVATLLVLAPVLGSRASLGRRVAAVAIAQLLQHGLYALPDASAAAAGHHHDPSAALGSLAVVHAHAAMPLAHLAAGLTTLWLLRVGPSAVAALLDAVSLRLAVATLDGTPPPARRRASVTASRPAPRAALDVLRDALERRGPPLPVG
ncbi:MAG: hypothetical protein ACQEWM_10555 [Actinomycetota bacterium]